MDLFSSGNNQNSSNNIRPVNNVNLNMNNKSNSASYFSPQPMRSGGLDNIFQQMPANNKLNLQKNNMNMGIHNDMLNANRMHSMQNINNLNNNLMNMNLNNNVNLGMNNNINNMNHFNNNNNMNNFNFNNPNMNNNNKPIQNNNSSSSSTNTNPIAFNMDYFNKNMEAKKSKEGSTYNFKKNKTDPFANLVSFKK